MRARPRPGELPRRSRPRRDRHDRGLRGPLAPARVPVARTREQVFDDLVSDARERLELRWSRELADVEFAVLPVPEADEVAQWLAVHGEIPLGAVLPAEDGEPAIVVVYRRPVELRAREPAERADLVHDVVVEQVARLLGLEPETVDPTYGGDED